MILQLNKTVTVNASTKVLGPKNNKIDITFVKILNIQDNCKNKVTALIMLNDFTSERLTLWEGEAYNNIGDWTQEQANQKIISLVDKLG